VDARPPSPVAPSSVTSWTPNEAWFFAELAKRALVVSVDGGAPERIAAWSETEGARVWLETHASEEVIRLSLHVDADRATVALAPERVSGSGWRDGWVLECLRGPPEAGGAAESWILKPGDEPALVEDARAAPLILELRVLRRAIVRHGETVPLADYAFHRYTRQSSSVELAEPLAWARPTRPEAAPWWEIDLGKVVLLAWLRVEIADVPPDTRVTVHVFDYFAKGGGPPSYCLTRSLVTSARDQDPDGPPRGSRGDVAVCVSDEVLARYVRVSLERPDGAPLTLRVTACEALAGELFAPSLRATMRRAFAIHHDKSLFLDRDAEGANDVTYGEARRRALLFANGLALRLEPAIRADGRVILAVLLRNRPEWVISDLAAIERGYVLVPIAPDEADERLGQILGRARPDAIVCDAKDAARAAAIGEARGLRLVVAVDGSRAVPSEARVACVAFDDLLRDDAPSASEPAPRDEDAL
jgi:hypothetical protein